MLQNYLLNILLKTQFNLFKNYILNIYCLFTILCNLSYVKNKYNIILNRNFVD